MRETEGGDRGKGVEEEVGMRILVPSVIFEGTGSCDGGGVGALGEGESLFALAFFTLARECLKEVLGLTSLQNFSFLFSSSSRRSSLWYSWLGP